MQSGAWSGHYRYFLFQHNTFLLIAYAFLNVKASIFQITDTAQVNVRMLDSRSLDEASPPAPLLICGFQLSPSPAFGGLR
jgi:hypothetical protein